MKRRFRTVVCGDFPTAGTEKATVGMDSHWRDKLDALPGQDWSEEDCERLRAWWMEAAQLRLVWHCAARYLGSDATPEDVEDAVVDFFRVLESARRSYRPGGPAFRDYLISVCFKHHCVRAGGRIRKRRRAEVPLERVTSDGDAFALELADDGEFGNPSRRAQGEAFLADLDRFLDGGYLSEVQKQAFGLRFLRGMSYEEVSDQMGVPLGSVKGWLSRATRVARVYLQERGWVEWTASE